jgi:hypothetical protein
MLSIGNNFKELKGGWRKLFPVFEQWKTGMAERSFSRYLDAPPVYDPWVHWLIEASLDPQKKKGMVYA